MFIILQYILNQGHYWHYQNVYDTNFTVSMQNIELPIKYIQGSIYYGRNILNYPQIFIAIGGDGGRLGVNTLLP